MAKDIIKQALESGDLDLAKSVISEINRRHSASIDARERVVLCLNGAVLCGMLRRFGDARRQFTLAAQEMPDDPGLRLQFDFIDGLLHHQEKHLAAALLQLTETLSRHSEQLQHPEARFIYEDIQQYRGYELFHLKKFDEAVPVLEECLSFGVKPETKSVILSNLGICYSELRDFHSAKDVLEQACNIGLAKRWEGAVHFHLAIAYAYLEMLKESKRELKICEERAAEFNAPIGAVYGWLSRVCKRLGEKTESEYYKRMTRPS